MYTNLISMLEESLKRDIKMERDFAEKCELRMRTLSNRRNIFGKIKDRDAYEEEQCWAYWHRSCVSAKESILETVKAVKEDYEDLQKNYRDLEKDYIKLKVEYKELEYKYETLSAQYDEVFEKTLNRTALEE